MKKLNKSIIIYIVSFDGFVGFLTSSSSSSSPDDETGSPIAFRRRSTAFCSSDLTIFFGTSGSSDSFDDANDSSSELSFLSTVIDCGFLVGFSNKLSSLSESLKKSIRYKNLNLADFVF
jgi:hypothetical protein